MFDAISMSSNEDINNFGILAHILPKLIELRARLLSGKFGLLKTCAYGEPLFFIFEPEESTTCFSSLGVLTLPYSAYYPLENSPNYSKGIDDQRAALYHYVGSNNKSYWKKSLKGNLPGITKVEYDTQQLLSSLEEQARSGNELIEFLRNS